jgi:metal-sulfur cluster biosynthetic enzyme
VSGASASEIEDAVVANVRGVLDPCGRVNGTGLSLGDLGMIDEVRLTGDGQVLVRLLLDDPLCLYMVDIHHEVRAAALAVDGIDDVVIEHSTDRLWDPDRMTQDAVERMARWRRQRLVRATGADSHLTLALLPFNSYRQ